MSDSWKHRSANMLCNSCMWFVEKALPACTIVKEGDKIRSEVGRCRRHDPTMNGYPVVFMNDWCGDHKLNENYANQS